MKPINKEQEQHIANIKGICEAIEKNLNESNTPQEIAEIFNASGHSEGRISCDCEYEEYIVDFEAGFGITFWKMDDGDWHWENEDEIWLHEKEEFVNWKSL